MSEVVNYEVSGSIAVITVNNPPVNALSQQLRQGLFAVIDRLNADDEALAAVLICTGKTFIAGADISEFNKPPLDPTLPEVISKIEASEKIIVAAIHGTALGGGFETAMACHYRCAVPSARVGLPEVTLGLLPGATGTQRLPRLIGIKMALDTIISGKPLSSVDACKFGAIDRIIEGGLLDGALEYTHELLTASAKPRRLSEQALDKTGLDNNFFKDYLQEIEKKYRGYFAPQRIVQCVEAAVYEPYLQAVKLERRLFNECKSSTHSQALRYLFFAEREVAKIPDLPVDTPKRNISSVAVVGAGTMGSAIAISFLNAGLAVYLLERNEDSLDHAIKLIRTTYESAVSKGHITRSQMDEYMSLIIGTVRYDHITDADLVVEAAFESMQIKQDVFRMIDAVSKPGAIFATNTSSLDLDAIASVTGRPEDVIGLHFFAPANVMDLVEVVRGHNTSNEVIATAMAVARKIKKTGVLVGNGFGFVGNRMYLQYMREAQLMTLEGMLPEHLDRIVYDWGMPMGPHAIMDLSGLDVFYRINQEWKDRPDDPAYFRLCKVLYEAGRFGQKTGAGIYQYQNREPIPDPEVIKIAIREAKNLGVVQRNISADEVIERLFYSMINEGARVLEEGKALRPGDIDVIFVHGYGFPRYYGGPMHYADTIGLSKVFEAICKYRDRYGEQYWTPAPLLESLAKREGTFNSL